MLFALSVVRRARSLQGANNCSVVNLVCTRFSIRSHHVTDNIVIKIISLAYDLSVLAYLRHEWVFWHTRWMAWNRLYSLGR